MTRIQWTDETWNPTRGCSKVSDGCRNCYAMRQAHRFSGPGQPYEGLTRTVPGKGPQWTGKVVTVPEMLTAPFRWRKPRRVFVDSMSDLFHTEVPREFIDRVFAVMALCPQHTFQILTKRPERMADYTQRRYMPGALNDAARLHSLAPRRYMTAPSIEAWPLPNVWLGISAEQQGEYECRIGSLARTLAAVRFVSAEPLLGPIDFGLLGACPADWGVGYDAVRSYVHWIILGGESGPGARPCRVDWIRDGVRQCSEAGVAAFVKQLGSNACVNVMTDSLADVHPVRDRKGGDPAEWPEELMVREFPEQPDGN